MAQRRATRVGIQVVASTRQAVRRRPTQGAGPRMNSLPSPSATPLRGQCLRSALRSNNVPMKTGHGMCPLTNDHGSGITGQRLVAGIERDGGRRWAALDVCASRSGLRPTLLAHTSRRDHRSSRQEKNELKLNTPRKPRAKRGYRCRKSPCRYSHNCRHSLMDRIEGRSLPCSR